MQHTHVDHNQFKQAVDEAYDHIIMTDTHGKIIYANKAASLTTGYSVEEMIGNTPRLWGGQMPSDVYEKMWHEISVKKKPFIGEFTNIRKGGEPYIAEVRISPVVDAHGSISFYVGIERDITVVKNLESQKSEFVSLASHQLRTPLSTLNWYSEILLSGDLGKLERKQKEYVKEIYGASRRMIALVNDLLNLSRIEMGRMAIQPTKVDIHELTKTILADLQKDIVDKQLTIKVEIVPEKIHVHSDPQMLSVILSNLIINAVKYTPKDGSVCIRVSEKKDTLHLEVSDTGYGIPLEEQRMIFSKFFRAKNAKQHVSSGTGLGLYILKAFTENIGGTVTFKSEEGKGTTFIIELPKHLRSEGVTKEAQQ